MALLCPLEGALNETLLCSTYYYVKLLQAKPIISDLALRAGGPKEQVFDDEIKKIFHARQSCKSCCLWQYKTCGADLPARQHNSALRFRIQTEHS